MILLLSSVSLAQGLPSVEVTWNKGVGLIDIQPPPGEHIADDAPVGGFVEVDGRRLGIEGLGDAVADGIAISVPGKDDRVVQGELALSLCLDDNTTCRPVQLGFIGTIDGKRGSRFVGVHEPAPPPTVEVAQHGTTPEEAFAQAADSGKLVLIDFGAVWCPPCNELAARVLKDDQNASDLEPFVVTEVDVDQSSSWDIKDRYAVGGYPTVVVARADGTEIDRHLGFSTEAEFVSWLGAVQDEVVPIDELLGRDLSPAETSELVLRLVRDGRDDEATELFESSEVNADLRIARVQVEATEDDVVWLAENAADRMYEWVWWADAELSPEGAAALDGAIRRALLDAEGAHASELIELLAERAPEDARASLYAAAATTLANSLSGDPTLDRAYYGHLAELYRLAGDTDAGIEVLREAASLYPHEFTFFYAAAGVLQRDEQYEEALAWSSAARALGYGDQALRAAGREARILVGLERTDDAIALIDATLAAAEAPDEGTDVRTFRYLAQLEDLRAELAGSAGEEPSEGE
ncbi:MAG: thioredoxin fold domain-containing protein [Proteobacteria bacterium]|nr:thioredoxin fold domain-containing protein [Pseudomonadota bacterium]